MDNKKAIYREIAGDAMLIPVGETVKKYNGIFMLTPSAAVMYKAYIAEKTRNEIVDEVLAAFDVDRETAETDFDEFISKLNEIGLI